MCSKALIDLKLTQHIFLSYHNILQRPISVTDLKSLKYKPIEIIYLSLITSLWMVYL